MRPVLLALALALAPLPALAQGVQYDPTPSAYRPGLTAGNPAPVIGAVSIGDSLTVRMEPSLDAALLALTPPVKLTKRAASSTFTDDHLAKWTAIRPKKPRRVWLMGGINDIRYSVSAVAAYANLNTVIGQAIADGRTVLLGTITPFNGDALYDSTKEAQRQALNQLIRTTPGVSVIDSDVLWRDGTDPTKLSAACDEGDHLHETAACAVTLANAITAEISNATLEWNRTNSLSNPFDFSQGTWSKFGTAAIQHASASCPLAPDGVSRMDLYSDSSGTGGGVAANAANTPNRKVWAANATGDSACVMGLGSWAGNYSTHTIGATPKKLQALRQTGQTGCWIFLSTCTRACIWGGMAYPNP